MACCISLNLSLDICRISKVCLKSMEGLSYVEGMNFHFYE